MTWLTACEFCGVDGSHADGCQASAMYAARDSRLGAHVREMRLRAHAARYCLRAMMVGVTERRHRLRGTTDFHALVWRRA